MTLKFWSGERFVIISFSSAVPTPLLDLYFSIISQNELPIAWSVSKVCLLILCSTCCFLGFFPFCFVISLIMFIQLLWELNMQSVWWNHVPCLSGKEENANLNFIQFSKAPWCKMLSSLTWCDLNWNHKGNWNVHEVLIALFGWD